ncbi:hypothetical protein CAEBREN_05057 [Caenorhabditis brenneri]|uniref:Uncharacterized protein n=1 Tax=Caenorhabditis brenneri TaxID=135651 RepID=G0MTV8_CAEBE|nr:hypothetical protein CAEBREN_05057 [Caenorhabditis brenneri]
MRRSEYEDVPNRIIPPYIPIDTRRFETDRSSRIPVAPAMRQPLLGEAPVDPYRQAYAQSMTFNGPVIEPSRRRGFDMGPTGEDFTLGGRQPLLKNPRIAVEHVGGDMDISRSRSSSPQIISGTKETLIPFFQVYNSSAVSARSVRDDRKNNRGDRGDRDDRVRQRRSRSRSRSRSRRDRDRSRTRTRDRVSSGRDRESVRDQYDHHPPVSNEPIRDGIVHTKDNYSEFLVYFIDEVNDRTRKSADRDVQGTRKIEENISSATASEKSRIILPPDFDRSEYRERMLHCDTTISGLPVSIFFGSGYGPRAHYAKNAAAKDFVDKCHRIGVVSSELHAAIGDWQEIDRSFKTKFSGQVSKAANAVILLIKKMTSEHLPPGFMTMRQLPTDLIDRFKTMLRMVMMDVYYQGIETSSTVVPSTLEIGHDPHSQTHSSRPRDSDLRRHNEQDHSTRGENNGSSAEDIIRLREKKIKEELEMELAQKRQEMEQEIRKQILEEERAKIRAELEMEKKLEIMKMQQQQYQIEKEKKEMEEQQRKASMLKQVEDSFNAMVEQLEQRFVEVRSKGLTHILDLIYASTTFKTIQLYSSTLTSISYEQKQQLVQDLKELLDTITSEVTKVTVQSALGRLAPMHGNFPPQPVAVVPMMPPYQLPQQPFNPTHIAQPSISSSSITRKDEVLEENFNFSKGFSEMTSLKVIEAYPDTHSKQLAEQFFMFASQQSLFFLVSIISSFFFFREIANFHSNQVRHLTLGNMHLRTLNSTEQRRLAKGDKVIAQDSKNGNWSLGVVQKINRDNRVTLSVGNTTWKKAIEDLYKEDSATSY